MVPISIGAMFLCCIFMLLLQNIYIYIRGNGYPDARSVGSKRPPRTPRVWYVVALKFLPLFVNSCGCFKITNNFVYVVVTKGRVITPHTHRCINIISNNNSNKQQLKIVPLTIATTATTSSAISAESGVKAVQETTQTTKTKKHHHQRCYPRPKRQHLQWRL